MEMILMNELQIFKNNDLGEVRTILDKNNNIWFCIPDIAKALNISNATQLTERIDVDDKAMFDIGLINGALVNFTNESGLYTILLRSDKEEAKPFKKWVTSEILPTIRKTGMYITDNIYNLMMNEPEKIGEILIEYGKTKKENESLKLDNQLKHQQIIEMQPKADFYDDVADSNNTCDMQTVAKLLNYKDVGRNTLFEILRDSKILQYDNIPYQKYVDRGWFRLIETKYHDKKTSEPRINFKTVVFQKGIEKISNLLKELGYQKVI